MRITAVRVLDHVPAAVYVLVLIYVYAYIITVLHPMMLNDIILDIVHHM